MKDPAFEKTSPRRPRSEFGLVLNMYLRISDVVIERSTIELALGPSPGSKLIYTPTEFFSALRIFSSSVSIPTDLFGTMDLNYLCGSTISGSSNFLFRCLGVG